MSTIEAQLDLEKYMIDRGSSSYLETHRFTEQKGRGSDTTYARRLMQEFTLPLVAALEAFQTSKGPASRGKARALLRRINAEKAVFITLKCVFNSFTLDEPVVAVAMKIGRMVEDEIRFSRFQEMHGDYYDTIIRGFKRKGTQDYRYMQRVLTHQANEMTDQWIVWTGPEKVDVGVRLLDLVLTNTDLIEKKIVTNKLKTEATIVPTASARKWVDEHEDVARFLFPDKMPCIIEPDEWTGLYQGGYYSPQMRQQTPMVKASSAMQKRLLEAADKTQVFSALNTVQRVPWEVNEKVLQVMKAVYAQNLGVGMPPAEPLQPAPNPLKDVPKEEMTPEQEERFKDWKREAAEVYTQEKERISKQFQVTRIMRMANQYLTHGRFWYVWYADFRGRLYTATSGFSPQGPDLAKGLLRFANGKALGVRGLYWLKVHGANRYGYDKDTYDGRVSWVDERHDEFLRAAADPLSYRETWAGADKPYQFLAFLFEYAEAHALTALGLSPEQYVSRLPVGLDGSCNGLQNFSAMLRDPVGGRATNLVPGDKPADIYSDVAKVCYGKIATQKDMEQWKTYCNDNGKGSVPRSLAKRPVMTLPYGATRQSCTSYIFQSILETDKAHFTEGNFAAACALTPYLWSSIGEVVVAARDAMDWLQKAASCMTRAGKPIVWTTNDNFPIVQYSRAIEIVRVDTQLAGRFQVKVGNHTDKIDGAKQRSGISPNFVHSMDACHLRTTVRLARENGIHDMSLIHDDYGTHASDTDVLQRCIREAFVSMYRDTDPLASFKQACEAAGGDLPDLPAKGSLDIEAVLESPYFFG